eukprot:UN32052
MCRRSTQSFGNVNISNTRKSYQKFFIMQLILDQGRCWCILSVFLPSVFTYGVRVPSGLFVPAILCGCAYGRLMGEIVRDVYDDVHPGTYALLGATSSLGGITRMTISLTIILLETTNDIQYLLPIMMVLMVSKWVGDFFNISLYDMHVELKCIPFVEANPPRIMESKSVRDVMSRPVRTVRKVTSVQAILDILKYKHNGFPVLNDNDKFVGLILRSQLRILINEKAYMKKDQILSDRHYDAKESRKRT